MPALLEIEGLRSHIRQRSREIVAVDGLSLRVEEGETVGLLGDSGCGKTMTALSVMQLLPPGGRIESGSIRLDGRELVGLSERELRRLRGREMAMIFQDPAAALNPTMSVGEQIAEGVRSHQHMSRGQALVRAEELLTLVGAPCPAVHLREFPHQLSGGLRQRVMIAIAVACEPRLLIADEPTTALDATVAAQVLELLRSLRDRFRMTVLLMTHDPLVVDRATDRVALMRAGRIVGSGPGEVPAETPRRPAPQPLPPSAWGLT